jgi:hypothetical protein
LTSTQVFCNPGLSYSCGSCFQWYTFLQYISALGLEDQNLLDVFFTNRPSLINRCEAIPGISDHEIVFVDSNIAISRQKPVKRKIYIWKKADTQKLKSKIEEMSNNILE